MFGSPNSWYGYCDDFRYLWNGGYGNDNGTTSKAALVLTQDEQAQVQSTACSRSISAALAARARIVLACTVGESLASVWLYANLAPPRRTILDIA